MCGDRCRYSRYHTCLATVAGTAGTIPVWRPLPVQPVPGDAYTNAALDKLEIRVLAAMQSPHAVHEWQLSLAYR